MTWPPIPPVDPDSLRVTWALPGVPLSLTDRERAQLLGWFVVHGIDPKRVRVTPSGMVGVGADVAIVSHPVHGDLIVYTQYEVDDSGAKMLDPVTGRPAVQVVVQPLGMPPPPSLCARGADHAAMWRLRLPVAALSSAA